MKKNIQLYFFTLITFINPYKKHNLTDFDDFIVKIKIEIDFNDECI